VTQPPQQPDPAANPPGWYPDPAGVAGRHRYWDGQQWQEEVTFDPTTPPPGQDSPGQGPSASPVMSRGARIGLFSVGGVVLVAIIVVLAMVLPGLLRSEPPVDPPTGPPPSSVGPTAPPSPGGSGELNCAGGNGVSIDGEATSYNSTGASVDVPEGWGFRLDKSQWTWLDDVAAWAKTFSEDDQRYVAAMALGGVAERNGFTDPEQATQAVITCLNRYGVYNDKEYPQQETASEAVTIGGMKGWKRVVEYTESSDGPYPKSEITVYVLDSGQPAKLVSLVTVAPIGHTESEEAVEGIAQSLTKQ